MESYRDLDFFSQEVIDKISEIEKKYIIVKKRMIICFAITIPLAVLFLAGLIFLSSEIFFFLLFVTGMVALSFTKDPEFEFSFKEILISSILNKFYSNTKYSYNPKPSTDKESLRASNLFSEFNRYNSEDYLSFEFEDKKLEFSEVDLTKVTKTRTKSGTSESCSKVARGLFGKVNHNKSLFPNSNSFLVIDYHHKRLFAGWKYILGIFIIIFLISAFASLGGGATFLVIFLTQFIVFSTAVLLFKSIEYLISYHVKNPDFDSDFRISKNYFEDNGIIENILTPDMQYALIDFGKTIYSAGYKKMKIAIHNNYLYFYIPKANIFSPKFGKKNMLLTESIQKDIDFIENIIYFSQNIPLIL